jgi:hypothetical protein
MAGCRKGTPVSTGAQPPISTALFRAERPAFKLLVSKNVSTSFVYLSMLDLVSYTDKKERKFS